ncbi:carboxypeptidase regulatory-like domain-containing protein [Streptomyces sp. SPB074]|uniref:carboxypeptidase regulatory-like domain-containing protein n=1 Tax=Streptomyces sp. (strain SPB074) TaxID=465543 RepID=UPI0001D1DB1A|nr:carboxypeptidase regulatory-like domain-containing protein [Streptomyces sp. SPB074]EFG65718.1 DNA-directed RNA polymerase II subunit RPB1 [Streptomyces sp. SPB074]
MVRAAPGTAPDTTAEEKGSSRETALTLVRTLWFPAFMFAGFLVCYLLPFHNPVPHHVKVAVPAATAAPLQRALDQAAPGGFDLVPVHDADAARAAVTGRDAVAGYVPGPGTPELFTAKADGYSLESVLQKTFTAIAQDSGGPHTGAAAGNALKITEVAPIAPGDGLGTGLFYVVLACTIPAYVMVMMMLRATNLGRRDKILVLAAAGAVLALVAYGVARWMDVIPNDPLAILFLFLMSQAVSQTALGLVPFVKQYLPGVAMGLFVLLSMPSSGGAIPIQMVPGFFRALHPVMPMGNLIEALRGLFYFGGKDVLPHVLVLLAWVAAAFVLHGLGALRARRAAGEAGGSAVPEPPVEDPVLETERPEALPPHRAAGRLPLPQLTGRVTGTDGEPLRDVVITVTGTHGRELLRATTGDDGAYAAAGLAEQTVVVIASAPTRLSAVARVAIRDGHPARHDFHLAGRPVTV